MSNRILSVPSREKRSWLTRVSFATLFSLLVHGGCSLQQKVEPTLSSDFPPKIGFETLPAYTPASSVVSPLELQPREEDAEYYLKVGDVIEILLYKGASSNNQALRQEVLVRPDGKISYFYVGDIQASGQTPEELRRQLKEALSVYIRSPEVTVLVVQARKKRVYVTGAVHHQGVHELETGQRDTLMDAIFLSNGLTPKANKSQAYVIRHNAFVRTDLRKLLFSGDQVENVVLQSGDVVYIPPELEQLVTVVGHVKRPNTIEVTESLRLIEAIAQAGDFSLGAKRDSVKIIRGGLPGGTEPSVVHTVNMDEILAGTHSEVYVRPGDIVFVPSTALGQWQDVLKQLLPTLQALWQGTLINNRGF